jgi:hypothetical protein
LAAAEQQIQPNNAKPESAGQQMTLLGVAKLTASAAVCPGSQLDNKQ